MRDPDRYLPDPGIETVTDELLQEAAESVDTTEWAVDLWDLHKDEDLLAWAKRCASQLSKAVDTAIEQANRKRERGER